MKQILLLCCVLLTALQACDPAYTRPGCDYEYPIQAQNLRRTIKTSDTIWITNDFDARLCLSEGIYQNGKGREVPAFFKLEVDTLKHYSPEIVPANVIQEGIEIFYENGRYKSKKYGIVFIYPGIYSLSSFGGILSNRVNNYC